jgi:general secretion pathway protein H
VNATSRARKSQSAFTLIEVLIALALAGLAAALVAPRVNDSLASHRSRAAVRAVADYLAQARADSVLRRSETLVTIDTQRLELSTTARATKLTLRPELRLDLVVAATEKTTAQIGGIRFFADGTATGGKVRLAGRGLDAVVDVHWLTGRVDVAVSKDGS